MVYRYLALLGDASGGSAPSLDPSQSHILEQAGLRERFAASGFRLLAAADTPMLDTPCGGILIGHLFSHDGTPVTCDAQLPQQAEPEAFRAALIQNFWGEYLLLQPANAQTPQAGIFRDPSGGVACFYALGSECRFATSDICLAIDLGLCERLVDWRFVSEFLAYTFLKTDRTGLQGVRELLPSTSLLLGAAGTTVSLNWSPWDFVSRKHYAPSLEEAAANVRQAIEMVINSWSSIDRTILLELSGGLDSSIVAACLGRTSAHVVCLTLVSAMPGGDERKYAGAIAEHSGLRLRAENLTLERGRIDAPVPLRAITPRAGPLQHAADEIMREVAGEEGLETFYSGGGGDTVFSYLSSAAPAADAFLKSGLVAGVKAVSDLSDLHQCTLWKAARLTAKKLRSHRPKPWQADLSFLAPGFSVEPPSPHPWSLAACQHAPGDVERVLALAGTQSFRDGLPRGTMDRLRMPLLTQPVMEACLAVPSWMWIAGGKNRSVARMAFADVLPANVLNRMSKGDFIQYCAAVYRHSRQHIRELLLDGELASQGLLDVDGLRAFFDRPPSPRDETFMRIFDLCTIESWIRQQP